ncbi:hypothetical protein NKG94_47740 [Micromonospora sp. M12]
MRRSRVFEKVYNKAVTTAQGAGGAKAKIFAWAVGVGKEKVTLEQAGKPVPGGLKLRYGLAEKLVFSKLQARLGGRMRVLVSGAARSARRSRPSSPRRTCRSPRATA